MSESCRRKIRKQSRRVAVSVETKVTIETVAVELYNDDDDIKEDQCNSECIRAVDSYCTSKCMRVYVGGQKSERESELR